MNFCQVSVLVVIYGKKLKESKTLMSLLTSNFYDFNLSIVNNGPTEISQDDEYLCEIKENIKTTSLINMLENAPLSKIYNSFIFNNKESKYYVFFDDDSEIEPDFLQKVSFSNVQLLLPRIYSIDDFKYYYPTEGDVVVVDEKKIIINSLMSISSGLAIEKELVRYFYNHYDGYVFDERFALYGVDTSFFLRLREISKSEIISVESSSILRHSLSRVVAEKSERRDIERLYDTAVTARHYPQFITKNHFFKIVLYYLLKKKFKYSLILILYFIKGKHPRCT